MVKKKIVWSLRAQQDKFKILDYWIDRNKSKTYAEKLLRLFNEAAILISHHPEIGKPTSVNNVRAKIIRDYLMIYEDKEFQVDILLIWDSRQKPSKLINQLKRRK